MFCAVNIVLTNLLLFFSKVICFTFHTFVAFPIFYKLQNNYYFDLLPFFSSENESNSAKFTLVHLNQSISPLLSPTWKILCFLYLAPNSMNS